MYTYNAKLERVVDGDTIHATADLGFDTWKRVVIRLDGINAPESRTKDLQEKSKGLAAKDRLEELLAENGNEFILISLGVDKYGRCLGKIYLDNEQTSISINQQLINEGHAVAYFGGAR